MGIAVTTRPWTAIPETTIPAFDGLILLAPESPLPDLARRAFGWLQAAGSAHQGKPILLAAILSLQGDFGLENGADSTLALAGLVKTAHHEWTYATCRVIDWGHAPARAVVDELLRAGPLEVGLQEGQIRQLTLQTRPQLASAPLTLLPGELIVVTGGARGVTAAAVLELARVYRPTLLLLGRTPPPVAEPAWLSEATNEAEIKRAIIANAGQRIAPREVQTEYHSIRAGRELRDNLRDIAATGAVLDYREVDIRDPAAVERAIAEARTNYGPVRGLIHGAGVLADKAIVDKTPEQFDAVYSTKVQGWHNLLLATEKDPLAFMAAFSSSTARFGRSGQCDYAAANEVLNAEVRRLAKRRPECRAVSFNWGPWDGGMVTPGLAKLFASEGVGLIPLRKGAKFFVAEFSQLDRPADVIAIQTLDSAERITISQDTCPWLRDHRLNDRAVLPLAVVVEAFAQFAARPNSKETILSLADVRVLQPLALQVGEVAALFVQVSGDRLELCDAANDRCRYRAEKSPRSEQSNESMDLGHLSPFPIPTSEVYRRVLFHGPSFQCISAIEGWSDAGIVVQAAMTFSFDVMWLRSELAYTNALGIDAALQAIILWTWAARGELSLPMAIGRYEQYRRPSNDESIVVKVSIRENRGALIRADATLSNEHGELLAKLENCEFVVNANLAKAFGKEAAMEVGA